MSEQEGKERWRRYVVGWWVCYGRVRIVEVR
jgi:hypothetical protein